MPDDSRHEAEQTTTSESRNGTSESQQAPANTAVRAGLDEFGLPLRNRPAREALTIHTGVEKPGSRHEDDSDDDGDEGFLTPVGDIEEDSRRSVHDDSLQTTAEPILRADVKSVETKDDGKSAMGAASAKTKGFPSNVENAESDDQPTQNSAIKPVEASLPDQAAQSEAAAPAKTDVAVSEEADGTVQPTPRVRTADLERPHSIVSNQSPETKRNTVSEWSHMQLAPREAEPEAENDEGEWQEMPAFATHTIYDDWGKVLAKEEAEMEDDNAYSGMGGAGRGYTKVQLDEDAKSATSMDDDTAYLFKQGQTTTLLEEDEEGRNMMEQMQATKELLTEGQRIAYVGVVKITTMDMLRDVEDITKTRGTRKVIESSSEDIRKWAQKIMLRLYGHMEISSAEQLMIEQLAQHGVQAGDLTSPLMQNARVKNPVMTEAEPDSTTSPQSTSVLSPSSSVLSPTAPVLSPTSNISTPATPGFNRMMAPPYEQNVGVEGMSVQSPSAIASQRKIDIDLRWTVLCDLFLVLVADSNYDARSRRLLERVGEALQITWLDICRFEKRVTDALEMQEEAEKENWNEEDNLEKREKSARNRRLMMMGLATVGGGLVIGLSAGLLAPVIGAGLAAGFTTIGVSGTATFFGGAGAAALITSTGVITGANIGVRASSKRMGPVKTFEYRPLHNNKRVNLIITIAGWMTGKVDDVRLPFSTVDPIMGDIYSVLWEPEMLQSMGQTINILATEALTTGLQQLLGSTVLVALMGALQVPLVLTKLSYLIDNPWNVSLARADQAGLILADSLMARNLGSRPITLIGFSIGSRVILACLKELVKKGAYGLVQNVYVYGSPMVVSKDDYMRARALIPGRFINGYATNDWILGYLFRATSGGIARVAGLAPVEVSGIENINVTEDVPGHMSYRAAMPKLMRKAGWEVESLEFTEIEDPDPDSHEKRQRELINEIEEARKDLRKEPSKKGLRALFSKNKKLTEKKEWETYDERNKAKGDGTGNGTNGDVDDSLSPVVHDDGRPVTFDIDAIAKEVAELSAQGIEIKEIKSTLPPIKLDMADVSPTNHDISDRARTSSLSTPSQPASAGRYEPVRPSAPNSAATEGYLSPQVKDPVVPKKTSWWRRSSRDTSAERANNATDRTRSPSLPAREEYVPTEAAQKAVRPELKTAATAPIAAAGSAGAIVGIEAGMGGNGAEHSTPELGFGHNAWADEDEFGNKIGAADEGQMTFE